MKDLIEYTEHSMTSLQEYIEESLLDDFDTLSKNMDDEIVQAIEQFLKNNFIGISKYKISQSPNPDGKYVVDCPGDIGVKNISIKSLTNDYFIWGKVNRFNCNLCTHLTSLEGAPEKVKWDFNCAGCNSLINLEGAPKEVGGSFNCNRCNSLASLKGAPEKVKGNFSFVIYVTL